MKQKRQRRMLWAKAGGLDKRFRNCYYSNGETGGKSRIHTVSDRIGVTRDDRTGTIAGYLGKL